MVCYKRSNKEFKNEKQVKHKWVLISKMEAFLFVSLHFLFYFISIYFPLFIKGSGLSERLKLKLK
uniref:Uncharacterized protein n=1 Tax=Octopus bimaculoides TaxID=37653 RepID=A0A0L8FH36_OCTBM